MNAVEVLLLCFFFLVLVFEVAFAICILGSFFPFFFSSLFSFRLRRVWWGNGMYYKHTKGVDSVILSLFGGFFSLLSYIA